MFMSIKISSSDLGAFANGGEWDCWTTPDAREEDLALLTSGCVLEEDIIIWASEKGEIVLEGENLAQYLTSNCYNEFYYNVPKGTKVKFVCDSYEVKECGLFDWSQPTSGETYSSKCTGTLTIQ